MLTRDGKEIVLKLILVTKIVPLFPRRCDGVSHVQRLLLAEGSAGLGTSHYLFFEGGGKVAIVLDLS